jgi:hypothetical protein
LPLLRDSLTVFEELIVEFEFSEALKLEPFLIVSLIETF